MTERLQHLFNSEDNNELERILPNRKRIALIAHDYKKKDLIEWVKFNRDVLKEHDLVGTETTGCLIEEATGLFVERYQSGPLGGDQQIGSDISVRE